MANLFIYLIEDTCIDCSKLDAPLFHLKVLRMIKKNLVISYVGMIFGDKDELSSFDIVSHDTQYYNFCNIQHF